MMLTEAIEKIICTRTCRLTSIQKRHLIWCLAPSMHVLVSRSQSMKTSQWRAAVHTPVVGYSRESAWIIAHVAASPTVTANSRSVVIGIGLRGWIRWRKMCRALGEWYSQNGIGHLFYQGSRSLGGGSLHPATIQYSVTQEYRLRR
jgi:hypothetical protein